MALPELHELRDSLNAKKLFTPRSKQARHLRRMAAEVTLYGWDDAVESRADLIRGIEAEDTHRHGTTGA